MTETCNYLNDNLLQGEVASKYYFNKNALVYNSESWLTSNKESKEILIGSNLELYWNEEKIIDWMSLGMTKLDGDNNLEKEYLNTIKYYKNQIN